MQTILFSHIVFCSLTFGKSKIHSITRKQEKVDLAQLNPTQFPQNRFPPHPSQPLTLTGAGPSPNFSHLLCRGAEKLRMGCLQLWHHGSELALQPQELLKHGKAGCGCKKTLKKMNHVSRKFKQKVCCIES